MNAIRTPRSYIVWINNLITIKTENQMPDAESDETLANAFADYFMEKISKIRDVL